MRIPHGPGGYGMVGGIFADVLAGLIFIICFVIVVGVLVVLVRFLLVATKAAEIYVWKNGPARPVAPATPAAATPPTTVSTANAPTAKAPTTTRSRTPKAPPSA